MRARQRRRRAGGPAASLRTSPQASRGPSGSQAGRPRPRRSRGPRRCSARGRRAPRQGKCRCRRRPARRQRREGAGAQQRQSSWGGREEWRSRGRGSSRPLRRCRRGAGSRRSSTRSTGRRARRCERQRRGKGRQRVRLRQWVSHPRCHRTRLSIHRDRNRPSTCGRPSCRRSASLATCFPRTAGRKTRFESEGRPHSGKQTHELPEFIDGLKGVAVDVRKTLADCLAVATRLVVDAGNVCCPKQLPQVRNGP